MMGLCHSNENKYNAVDSVPSSIVIFANFLKSSVLVITCETKIVDHFDQNLEKSS